MIWVSDFVEELMAANQDQWFRWVQGLTSEGSRVVAVHVSSPSEAQLTGWVRASAPRGFLDRTGLTEADLSAKLAEHVADLRKRCEQYGVPLVCLHALMDTTEFVRAFTDGEVVR